MVRPIAHIQDPFNLPDDSGRKHHLIQFYDDERFVFEVLSLFTSNGLREGDGVIVAATGPHLKVIEAHLECLERGLKSDAEQRGQLVLINAEEAIDGFLLEGALNTSRFIDSVGTLFRKLKSKYPRIRVYGEMASLLLGQENLPAAVALENIWNELARIHDFKLLCVYFMSSFKDGEKNHAFDQICHLHSHVFPAEDFLSLKDEESKNRMIAKLQQRSKTLDAEMQFQRERVELVRLEKEARAEAERANRAKDEFLAIVSHELRTPLQPILSWIQLIKMGRLSPSEVSRGLQIIETCARSQTQIINDLLDVSRVISGKMALETSRVDLAALITTALETARSEADAAGVRINSTIEDELFVNGDPARLQQIVWNLLSNSLKFTPKGGQIDLAVEALGSYAKITVKDNGVGIPHDFLPHLFERFQQENSSKTRPKGGLGLGLSIVSALVQQHGGTVRAESEGVGKGSLFTVFLPLLERSALTQGVPPLETANIGRQEWVALNGIKILVIDDEAETREAITRVLAACGADIRSAGSVTEAFQELKRRIPDVVLSDLGMPGEDGYSFIRKLRKLPPSEGGDLPAVAFTAFAGKLDAVEALKAGFQAHLGKPVDAITLSHVIAKLTNRMAKSDVDSRKNVA